MSMSLLHDSNIGWAKGRERQCQKIKVCSHTSMIMNKYIICQLGYKKLSKKDI